jgi:transcriptional regulator of acetoin/glycerol metabolism
LHAQVAPAQEAPARLPSLRESERSHIVRVLEAVSWNKKEAARILDISRGTLYRKIVEFSLEPEASASRNKTRRPLAATDVQ